AEVPHDLIERETQLTELRCLLEQARSGRGSLLFLAGEAGVGETSLVQAFLADAGPHVRAMIGACDPTSNPSPLWPIRDISSAIDWEPGRALASGAPRDEIFAGILDELRDSSAVSILVFEDVHWADDATNDFLRFIGRRIFQTHAMVLASYRNDDLARIRPLR